MTYKLNGKNIRIPDSDIQRSVKTLGISQDEAIQVWLEDEGYLENEEQEELEKKAKENRVTATIHQARADNGKKKTQRERVQKDDPAKEQLIQSFVQMLQSTEGISKVEIVNKSKLISFELDGESYEVNLVRHRPPKKEAPN